MKNKINFKKLIKRNHCPICNSSKNDNWDLTKNEINYLECCNCSMVFTDKIIPISESTNFYKGFNISRNEEDSKLAEKRREMYRIDYDYMINFLIRSGNILDIGCGVGEFLQLFNNNINKFGLEIDQKAIDIGSKKFPETTFFNNYNDIKKTNIKFMTIIFRGSFQYIADIIPILDLCYDLLIENGNICMLSLPNNKSPLALLQRENWSMSNKLEHVNLYNLKVIDILFENKFKILDYKFPYIGTPYENLDIDLEKFINLCKWRKKFQKIKFPFWGSLINLIAKRI